MKSSVFWVMTPCRPLKINRRLQGSCRLHLQGQRKSQAWLAECWFLACFTFPPWRWRRYVFSKFLLIFNGLHGIISQKTELFATISSNLKKETLPLEVVSYILILFSHIYLSSSPNIIRIIKSRTIRWAWHIERMGRSWMHAVFRWEIQKEWPLRTLRRRWEDNIKVDFREIR
jgi:hypothetical protein